MAKKQANPMVDLAVALADAKAKGPVVLFPNGLPSAKNGRYAALNGNEVIAQGNRVKDVEKKVAQEGRGPAVVIDVSFDYSQRCFF